MLELRTDERVSTQGVRATTTDLSDQGQVVRRPINGEPSPPPPPSTCPPLPPCHRPRHLLVPLVGCFLLPSSVFLSSEAQAGSTALRARGNRMRSEAFRLLTLARG
eukprot:759815-Hanusia_phi.AAC.1